MPIRKTRLTTSTLGRRLRRFYRFQVGLRGQDALATWRTRRGAPANTPEFLVIGANKAGTTALFETLVGLPGFGSPVRKEIHYFDLFPQRSFGWYRTHFHGPAGLCWGEATPEYLDTPGVAEHVHRTMPDVKLVVCLREPVARAVSHFHNAVDHGSEHRSLREAVTAEVAVLDRPLTRSEVGNAYVRRSRYLRGLRPWLELFPREQLLVLFADERDKSVAQVLEFLDRPVSDAVPLGVANVRDYPDPPQDVVELIRDAVRADVHELAEVLGLPDLPRRWNL